MSEIIFEVHEDEADGGFTASAPGYGIHTQAETREALRAMVREAVECYFENAADAPKLIRLHFVHDEVIAA
jgi:predicted RNase H-like HicB family nuclease